MTSKVKSSKLTTMKLLLTLFLLLISTAVTAASDAYRVEVIVFRHLFATPEPKETTELRSFSRFPDLEEKTRVENLPGSTDTSQQLPGELIEALRSDLPDDLRAIDEKSSQMDSTWRRLRSSKGYRPLHYASWEQNRIDYYPPVRIHDQQVIDTQLQAPTNVLLADLTAEDPLAAYRSHFYQLDGSLQLRRSRFLHLYLDLELREEAFRSTQTEEVEQQVAGESFFTTMDEPALTNTDVSAIPGYGVYSLQQNRQVTTGKMQYFDTPNFGALVYVTRIQGN